MVETAKRRDHGMGYIYQRSNGSWVGRIQDGRKPNGTVNYHLFTGKTEAEVRKKIKLFKNGGLPAPVTKISVGTYATNWLTKYKKDSVKRSSYDRQEKTLQHQVIPHIGNIQLQQLISDDIQQMLSDLKNEGYSYSTIKKSYDFMNALLKHAIINGDVEKNPMLTVNMPAKGQFQQKEIRYFTKEEAKKIVEETDRRYSTGSRVYIYGDAYILMLNTGIRMGELIGLKKSDWDQEKETLHIQRNVESVKKRDENGTTGGYELIENTTKTYSGDRILPLNEAATQALRRMCAQHPKSDYIVCSSKGERVPPERVERTFYRMLQNIGIEKTGVHSLRHTFASFCFANGTDVKTVSKLLGHASIQITLNTYIHLIGEPDKDAVVNLNNFLTD